MIVPIALMLAAPDYASVSPFRGADLVQECGKRDGMELDPCVAYILGASDILSANRKFCLGGDAYALQVVAVVRRFLRDHPENWGKHPLWLVQEPLTKAFPCKR